MSSAPLRASLLRNNVLAFLAFVVASMYGLWVARGDGPVAIAWPASAVALSAVAVAGWRVFPGIAAGAITAATLDGRSLPIAMWFVLPALVEAAVSVGLCRRVKVNLRFEAVSDSLNLAWIAAVASAGGALTGATILMATGSIQHGPFWQVFASWMLGDAVGILAFAPAFLIWLQPPLRISRPRRPELVLMAMAAALVSAFVLVQYTVGLTSRSVTILLALFPLLMWISLRADLPVAAVFVVLLSIAATLGVKLGTGALISSSVTRGIINVQTLHVLSVLLVLVGAASVSARERALAQALASEQKLSIVFEGTSDTHTLYEIDAGGVPRVLMGNQRWFDGLRLFRSGLMAPDTLGKTMDEMGDLLGIGPEGRSPHIQPMLDAVRSGRHVQYEVDVPSPLGVRSVETTLFPMAAGTGPNRYVLATSRDVTEKRQAERRLRESEVRFAAVSDATHDVQMLFAVQADGGLPLTYMNRAGLEAWAWLWPEPAFEGTSLEKLLAARPGATKVQILRNLALFREAIATGQAMRFEDSFETPAGKRTAEVTVIPIADSMGGVMHVLRSSTDITDRKIAEADHKRFSDDLERRVQERTAQLAMANRELEAFSYSLSHDLRAPLRSIEGFSRALIEDYEADLAPEASEYARRIHVATGRMKQLLDDLLRLSQLPTANLDRERIDLSTMVRNVLAELRAADGERDVHIAVQEGMFAHGDARLVSIAMQNLLGNAWKYTSKRPDAAIEVGQTAGNGSPVTFVRDNGAGFDPRFAEHLFAPFQRLHRAEDYEGAGIGLATVRRIVAAHGGRVWADGRPEEGATFWFTLGTAEGA